ncbi:MAG: GNAT family N-acetyltransferase [Ramlibacter sp.]|nr:GNAT family N-acetyltransferase [Ramlibacter sp.]
MCNVPSLIRAALPSDEPAWRKLWRGYCKFYGVTLPDEVTARTWKRILDPDSAVMCIVAELQGKVCGFAHCVVHENTWEAQPVCYLEDLFVAPAARERGVARSLLEWLRNAMRAEGWARLYWMTRADNVAARRLYDQFAQADGFVRYVILDR